MRRIPVSGPWVTQREIDYVADAAATGWYETAGVYPQRFEQAFAKAIGVRYAVSLPHCTSAIHLALVAAGVGPGDEVIVPDATWIASVAPVTYVGATPVFADIDPITWCLSAESLQQCLSPRTKAVIPVDLYGGMPEWHAIRRIADDAGIFVIEDAAEAAGSKYHGRMAGAWGDVGVFSFHGSKTLTTGEGGMLVTDSERLHQRVLTLRDHGRPPGDRMFFNTEVAFKYKMSALQAAFGLAQTERIDELVAQKRRIFQWYRDRLAGHPWLTLNAEPSGTTNSYWMVTVIVDPEAAISKTELMAKLSERGIDTRPFFHPLTSLPAFENATDGPRARRANVVSYRIAPHGINLPSAMCLTEADVEQVCAALLDCLRAAPSRLAAAG